MRAIRITEFGGPEVLTLADLPDPEPDLGELLVNVSRAGVNYADTHEIEDSYLAAASLPLVPGGEVVGTTGGRRVVAFTTGGGYAQRAIALEPLAWDVPPDIDDVTALAMLVQGATAWMLLRRLTGGESVVVHAAAGGVGSLAVQLARVRGAGRVIATASTPEKRALARELGADVALDPRTEDLTAALLDANGGRGVDVVLEMTGGEVTGRSLGALAPFGRLSFYGMASRTPPAPVVLTDLMARSITVEGMWLPHVLQLPGDVMRTALDDLFGLVRSGRLRVIPGGEYGLSEARRAHEDLRARRTTGKLVLDPSR